MGVRQGWLFSPIPFNLFLEKITKQTLYNYHASNSVDDRPVCNLRFTNDIDPIGGSNAELQDLTNRVVDSARAYVTRHDSLSKTILHGTMDSGRRRGQQTKSWMDSAKEWTSLPVPELLSAAFRRQRKRWEDNIREWTGLELSLIHI